jgi:hypothetical protein
VKNIALISDSDHVSRSLLDQIGAAVGKQLAGDLARHWTVTGTIATFGTLMEMPAGYSPIVIKDSVPFDGAVGAHWTNAGDPFAVVLGTSDPNEVSLAVSHEAIEMMVDPAGYALRPGASPVAGQGKVRFVVEICDPVQDRDCGYRIDGILLSDFCTPGYFEAGPAPYSLRRNVGAAHSLAAGGYLSWLTADNHIWQGVGVGVGAALTATDKGPYDPTLPIRYQTDRLGASHTMAAIRNSGRRRKPFIAGRPLKRADRKHAIMARLDDLLATSQDASAASRVPGPNVQTGTFRTRKRQ